MKKVSCMLKKFIQKSKKKEWKKTSRLIEKRIETEKKNMGLSKNSRHTLECKCRCEQTDMKFEIVM